MKKLTYGQQLAHPNWQRRRLEMLSAANFTCAACSDTEEQLHVHHRAYFKGRMAWEYSDQELVVLCHSCHEVEHFEDDNLKRMLLLVPVGQEPLFNAVAILGGFFGADNPAVSDLCAEVGVHTRFHTIGRIAARMRDIPEHRLVDLFALINDLAKKET